MCLSRRALIIPGFLRSLTSIKFLGENNKETYEWILSSKRNVRVDKVKLSDSCRIIDMGFKMPKEVKEYCEWHLRKSERKGNNCNMFLFK